MELWTFSSIIERVQAGAIPAWLRDHVIQHRDEIRKALLEGHPYTFTSPTGEGITIQIGGAKTHPLH